MDKKAFLKTRKGAAVIMVVLILFACFLGSSRSLGKLYKNVEQAFVEGTGASDVSILDCLAERAEYARNLVTVADRYLSSSDDASKAVTKAVEKLEKASGVSNLFDANVELTDKVATLYSKLEGAKLTDSDLLLVKKVYQNFKSLNDQISHADYNAVANEYNRVFKDSPLSFLSGQRKADLFQ